MRGGACWGGVCWKGKEGDMDAILIEKLEEVFIETIGSKRGSFGSLLRT